MAEQGSTPAVVVEDSGQEPVIRLQRLTVCTPSSDAAFASPPDYTPSSSLSGELETLKIEDASQSAAANLERVIDDICCKPSASRLYFFNDAGERCYPPLALRGLSPVVDLTQDELTLTYDYGDLRVHMRVANDDDATTLHRAIADKVGTLLARSRIASRQASSQYIIENTTFRRTRTPSIANKDVEASASVPAPSFSDIAEEMQGQEASSSSSSENASPAPSPTLALKMQDRQQASSPDSPFNRRRAEKRRPRGHSNASASPASPHMRTKSEAISESSGDAGDDVSAVMLRADDGNQMILQFSEGAFLFMAGTQAKLLDYLANTHVRGLVCQAPRTGRSQSIFERKIGSQAMTTETSDKRFRQVFLLTFRLLLSPSQLLAFLQQRFATPEDGVELDEEDIDAMDESDYQARVLGQARNTQDRVLHVMFDWIFHHWQDFVMSADLRSELSTFLQEIEEAGYTRWVSKLTAEMSRQDAEWQAAKLGPLHNIPGRNEWSQRGPVQNVLLNMSEADLALQLTRLNAKLFQAVKPVEFVNYVRNKKIRDLAADDPLSFTANLDRLVERVEKESKWAAAEVEIQGNPKAQGAMIAKFVKVAKKCLELRNFHSFFAILSGIGSSKILKLKDAWKHVPKKRVKLLHHYDTSLLNPSKNMGQYRKTLAAFEKDDRPLLPFLPILLKDLFFWNEGVADTLNDMINFDKLRSLASHAQKLADSVAGDFGGVDDKGIQAYLVIAQLD